MWHCVARAAPGDRMLSDDEWAHVAAEIMHRTGLAPHGQEDDAVRWVAIRHADDHIHIVATLARQDGGRPRLSNDYYRVREACLAAEARFGLRRTAPGDRTAAARPTRAETEKASRRGWHGGASGHPQARGQHRRREPQPASRISSPACSEAGVLVRQRYSTRNPGEVTGYAVALPARHHERGRASLVRRREAGRRPDPAQAPPPLDRQPRQPPRPGGPAHTAGTGRDLGARRPDRADAAGQIRSPRRRRYPAAAADAAWATGDILHAAASALGSRVIRQAASAYDRAARAPVRPDPRAAPRPGTACAGPPGCCPPPRSPATTAPSPRPR